MVTAALSRVDALLVRPRDVTERQHAVRTAVLLSERAELTGRDADQEAALRFASGAVAAGNTHDDLLLTLAKLHLARHDLVAADRVLAQWSRSSSSPSGRLARAGLQRQRGDLVGAAGSYLALEPTWSSVAGVAGVLDDLGEYALADQLYRHAEEDVDATQLAALAWVEAQRARLWLRRHDAARAAVHLARAAAADPGSWRVLELRARVHSAGGRYAEAAAAYGRLVSRTGRPDHEHAFGDALVALGRRAQARAAYGAAASGYRRSIGRGSPAYLHHYAEFCLEVSGEPELAERCARTDHAARPNRHTGLVLARVLTALGDTHQSRRLTDRLESDRATMAVQVRELVRTKVPFARID